MCSVQIFLITISMSWVSCTITGLNYMEPINFKPLKSVIPGEDPCNPLYWYPRNIPEYCYNKNVPKPEKKPNAIPLPIPVPIPPQPFSYHIPMPPMNPPYPMPPPYPMQPPYPIAPPYPLPTAFMMSAPSLPPMPMLAPPIPLPYGVPLEPTNPMLPVAGMPGIPYFNPLQPYRERPQAGMVPGLPGLVTEDGGINILPFSDAYADLLEKHKQKMMRKKLQRIFGDYDDYSSKRRYKKHKRGISY